MTEVVKLHTHENTFVSEAALKINDKLKMSDEQNSGKGYIQGQSYP